jgi:hypothetical protein
MATNPYVNKVVFGAVSIIDISPTTAVESDVAQGKIFYKASGAQAVGTSQGSTLPDGDNLGYGGAAIVGSAIVGTATAG